MDGAYIIKLEMAILQNIEQVIKKHGRQQSHTDIPP